MTVIRGLDWSGNGPATPHGQLPHLGPFVDVEPFDPTIRTAKVSQSVAVNGGPRLVRLDREQCTRLLSETSLGRISLTISALPVIRTVRYGLAGGQIVFRAAPRSRLRAAAAGSVVAFQADCGGEADGIGWSVMVQGRCQEVTDRERIRNLQGLPLPAWSADQDAFLSVSLTEVSGEAIYWCHLESDLSRSRSS